MKCHSALSKKIDVFYIYILGGASKYVLELDILGRAAHTLIYETLIPSIIRCMSDLGIGAQ